MACVFPFKIDFTDSFFAKFPFIADGKPLPDIFCGLSSRLAGDMKYGEKNPNRLFLFEKLKIDSKNIFGLNQIHSRNVLVVDSNNPPGVEADGMVTRDSNVTLSVTVADCLPVFLLDTRTRAFGIVHSGWKGTGIASDALRLMKNHFGTSARDVAVVLGPCIGECCYKTDKERAKSFAKEFGVRCIRKENNFFIDIKKANIKLLSSAGVRHIAVCEDCTCCNDKFGSFRREGEEYTRMTAIITCKI